MRTVKMVMLGHKIRLPDGVKITKAEELKGLDAVERATASGTWLEMTADQSEELVRNILTGAAGRTLTRKEAITFHVKYYDEKKGLI